jgi:hypothetical protein
MVAPTIRPVAEAAPAALAFRTLLYRYLFFGWLFRDVTRGNLFERAAAWRHNLAQAHWLFVYLRRWVVLGTLFYVLGNLVEYGLDQVVLSAFFYVPSALSVAVNAVIGAAIAGFKMMPAPTP